MNKNVARSYYNNNFRGTGCFFIPPPLFHAVTPKRNIGSQKVKALLTSLLNAQFGSFIYM